MIHSIKRLIIVFVKNPKIEMVKTRLASKLGHEKARDIYIELVEITKRAVNDLPIEKWIYFSEEASATEWPEHHVAVQKGADLGERMCNAFKDAFNKGYDEVVLIGSDLPDVSSSLLESAFDRFKEAELVFGPSVDGGYYLVGMSRLINDIFKNKPWSQPQLLQNTLDELHQLQVKVALLEPLNDIDTLEDYKNSTLFIRKQTSMTSL